MENNFNIFHFEKNGVPMVEMTKDDFTGLIAEITTNSINAACSHKEEDPTSAVKPAENVEKVDFISIDKEEYRTYHFPDGSEYTIVLPEKLNVKRKPEGDSHRVIDSENTSHYVRAGWIAISWRGKEGKQEYSF